MTILYKNNASSTLSGGISANDTIIPIQAGDDGKFPVIASVGTDYFYVTLEDSAHNIEIVKVLQHVSGSNQLNINVVGNRGLDGTTSRAWVVGDAVEMRLNAAALADFQTIINAGQALIVSGVAGTNTITGTVTLPAFAYSSGQMLHFIAAGANTGATTLNINAAGAKNITNASGGALVGGEILAGAAIIAVYDGTQFKLTGAANPTASTRMTLISTQTLVAAASQVDFTGLNGDVDGMYELEGLMVGNSVAIAPFLRFNDDASTLYGMQGVRHDFGSGTLIQQVDAGTSGKMDLRILHPSTNSAFSFFKMTIFPKTGTYRVATWQGSANVSQGGIVGVDYVSASGKYFNSAANITKISIIDLAVNAFGVGSQFRLYTLRA